jgi:hypothetical protein
MTKTPRHPPRDETTGGYVGSLAASVALDGPQCQTIRKLLAESPLSATQLQLKLASDKPAIAFNPFVGEEIRKYLTRLVNDGEAVMVTKTTRRNQPAFTGLYQLSDKGAELLKKGL